MKNMDLSQLSSFGDFFLSIKSFCCNNIRSSMSEKDGFRIDMGMNAFRIIIIWFNLDVVNCELVSSFFHKNMNIVFFQNFRVQPDWKASKKTICKLNDPTTTVRTEIQFFSFSLSDVS